MSKKDIRSVAYLFNEMDPAEKLEFERELESDNNLLIEVETLRNITERLDRIELVNPPSHIVDAIHSVAFQKSSTSIKNTYWRTTYFAVAAIILIGMTSGIFLLDNIEKNSSSGQSDEAAIGTPSFYNNSLQNSSAVTANDRRISPWVDNNEVLHIHDRIQAENKDSEDSVFQHSFQRLTPVTDPAQSRSYHRNLHLTGSHR